MTGDHHADLVDIVPPAAPPAPDWHVVAMVGVAIVLAVMLLAWLWWRRTRRPRARRRLHALQRALRQRRIEPRDAAFAAAAALRQGLALRRLDASTPLPEPRRRRDPATGQRWRHLATTLSDCRYAPTPPPHQRTLDLLREADRWLRPWT